MIRPTERYAVGLYRVSTAEQGQSGLGLEALNKVFATGKKCANRPSRKVTSRETIKMAL